MIYDNDVRLCVHNTPAICVLLVFLCVCELQCLEVADKMRKTRLCSKAPWKK